MVTGSRTWRRRELTPTGPRRSSPALNFTEPEYRADQAGTYLAAPMIARLAGEARRTGRDARYGGQVGHPDCVLGCRDQESFNAVQQGSSGTVTGMRPGAAAALPSRERWQAAATARKAAGPGPGSSTGSS